MPTYRKGDDQSPLFNRAVEQRESHVRNEADTNGYIIGMNPNMSVKEYEDMGGGPVSAKGMRMGADAKHWKDRYPHMWGSKE